MPSRRRIVRIVLRTVAIVAAALIVLAVALPLWLPWELRPATKPWHLSYDRYERIGYDRFRLTGVSVKTKSGEFRAKQAEGLIPTTWLSRVWRHAGEAPFL